LNKAVFPPFKVQTPLREAYIELSMKAGFYKALVFSVLDRFVGQNPPNYLCG
jgi:hypothetical protein